MSKRSRTQSCEPWRASRTRRPRPSRPCPSPRHPPPNRSRKMSRRSQTALLPSSRRVSRARLLSTSLRRGPRPHSRRWSRSRCRRPRRASRPSAQRARSSGRSARRPRHARQQSSRPRLRPRGSQRLGLTGRRLQATPPPRKPPRRLVRRQACPAHCPPFGRARPRRWGEIGRSSGSPGVRSRLRRWPSGRSAGPSRSRPVLGREPPSRARRSARGHIRSTRHVPGPPTGLRVSGKTKHGGLPLRSARRRRPRAPLDGLSTTAYLPSLRCWRSS
jgi:hypothetical protein